MKCEGYEVPPNLHYKNSLGDPPCCYFLITEIAGSPLLKIVSTTASTLREVLIPTLSYTGTEISLMSLANYSTNSLTNSNIIHIA